MDSRTALRRQHHSGLQRDEPGELFVGKLVGDEDRKEMEETTGSPAPAARAGGRQKAIRRMRAG
jgi:hypothetical protein